MSEWAMTNLDDGGLRIKGPGLHKTFYGAEGHARAAELMERMTYDNGTQGRHWCPRDYLVTSTRWSHAADDGSLMHEFWVYWNCDYCGAGAVVDRWFARPRQKVSGQDYPDSHYLDIARKRGWLPVGEYGEVKRAYAAEASA